MKASVSLQRAASSFDAGSNSQMNLDVLSRELRRDGGHARDVAARMPKACDQSRGDWIASASHDDGISAVASLAARTEGVSQATITSTFWWLGARPDRAFGHLF